MTVTAQARTTSGVSGAIQSASQGLLAALSPKVEWLLFFALFANLATVVWTVESADWADTPSLVLLVFLGMVTALVTSRLRVQGLLLVPAGLAIGFVTVMWQGSSLVEGGWMWDRAGVVWGRVGEWIVAARSGGISIDPLPFSLFLTALSWLIGYLAAWAIFRLHNIWVPILLGGAGILTNLAYLPDRFTTSFVLYLFTAMLLIIAFGIVRRHDHWQRSHAQYPELAWMYSLQEGIFFAVIVLIITFSLPVGRGITTLMRTYEVLRSPIENFRSDFNRLFAALPARKPLPYRIFDQVLPFQGTINLATTPVLQVEASQPTYWKVRSYDLYTPKGWMSGEVVRLPADWKPAYSQRQEYQRRIRISQKVTLNASTSVVVSGFTDALRPSEASGWLMESYQPTVYTLNLNNPARDLPEDIQGLASELRRNPQLLTRQGFDDLLSLLPEDLVVVGRTYSGDRLATLNLARELPDPPDILAIHSPEWLRPGSSYVIESSVSIATPAELRAAGEDYPGWVTDRYLQLPPELPARVRALARDITRNAPTPYDKAQAIVRYLSTFQYDTNIPPPPLNGDGVDHFLFTLRRGYSDYFASAMAVLLRSVGVPARLAAGYTTGEKAENSNVYVVRDSNSHAWVEVFFPSYGWVPFEPTPGQVAPSVVEPAPVEPPPFIPPSGEEPPFEEEPVGPINIPNLPRDTVTWNERLLSLLPWLSIPLGLALVAAALWRWLLAPPADPERAYRRLTLLGALAGVGLRPWQTPYQYGETLGSAIPSHKGPVRVIVEAYVRLRYGRRSLSPQEQERLASAWVDLRGPLLLRVFKRR